MLQLFLFLGISTYLLSLLLTPLVRDFALRRGWVDQPDSGRKQHKIAVPRVGGVAIFAAYAISMGIANFEPFRMDRVFNGSSTNMAGVAAAIAIVFFTGLLDDLFRLRPTHKLVLLFAASLLAIKSGVVVDFFGREWGGMISIPLTVFWLVGCSNAFNLIDGMDGLASGVGLVASITMLVAALTMKNYALALLVLPLIGVLLGFLRYNFNPASIFLGDSGSLTIGFMLGCFGAIWSQKAATLLGLSAPLLALAVPFADVVLAIARRFLRNQPIFEGDASHIHHRLLRRGLTVRGAVVLLYGVCVLASIASLSVTALQLKSWGAGIVVLLGVLFWVAIQQLKYAEFSVARRMLFTSEFRRFIDAHTRFAHFEERLAAARNMDELWEATKESVHQFDFLGARLSVNGRVYESLPSNIDRLQHWQMRIPLPNGQHANFYRSFGSQISPLLINLFVVAMEVNINRLFRSLDHEAQKEEKVA